MIKTLPRVLFTAASLATLASCVSVLPEQPRPQAVYTIPTPQTLASLESNVVIREPDSPRLFGARMITSRASDGGLQVVQNVAWAERATRMFQVALIDAFASDGPGLAVDNVTGVSGQYELYWRVSDFSLQGSVGNCTLQLTLLDGRSREPIAQESVSATSTAGGENELARARALADAGRQCVELAAGFVADRAVDPDNRPDEASVL